LPLLALASVALFLFAPTGSSACGCGPRVRFVVAHGTSPHGARWRIKADESRGSNPSARFAEFEFSSGKTGKSIGRGYLSGMPLPIPPSFTFHANVGSGVYPELEGDASGFAQAKAVRLVARMSNGTSLEIELEKPPARLYKRFPWLRGLVFFDQFYPAGIEPTEISAYDQTGQLLDRQPA
jgi:hypothetical protein